jgi:nucleoid-associated protein YgaU
MKQLLISVASVLILSLVPVSALAVEYGGVGGRPANPQEDNPRSQSIFVYELSPGESYKDGVEVFNNTADERTVTVGAVDSAPASDGAFACAQAGEPKVSVGSWITLSATSVTIPAGKSKVVNFTITAPANASVGEQSGCITIQDAQTEGTPQDGGVVLTFRSAIRVAVTVPGEITKAVSISGISVSRSSSDATMFTVQPILLNTGNVSLDTNVDVRFVSVLGDVVGTKKGTYPVLPATTAKWNFDFDQPFWGGWYRADVIATYNNNVDDSLGQNSDGSSISVSSQSSYVYIAPAPLAAIIELAILALFVVMGILLFRKLRHRRTVARHWTTYSIKPGDSIQSIAKSKHVPWRKLASANKLRAPYHLEPGKSIKIPPKSE